MFNAVDFLKVDEENIKNRVLSLGDDRNANYNEIFKEGITFGNSNFDIHNPSSYYVLSERLRDEEFYQGLIFDDYLSIIDSNVNSIKTLLSLVNTLMLARTGDETVGEHFIKFLEECDCFLHCEFVSIREIINDFDRLETLVGICEIAYTIRQFKEFHLIRKQFMEWYKNNSTYSSHTCVDYDMDSECGHLSDAENVNTLFG